MTRELSVVKVGPLVTLQDHGRLGYQGYGLSRGGAADRLALAEGAELLTQSTELSALEMFGFGGEFVANCDIRIALTGGTMKASLDSAPIHWNASHTMYAGQTLSIGACAEGNIGYLHVGGGLGSHKVLQSCSAHLAGGIGHPLAAGDVVGIGPDTARSRSGDVLAPSDRFNGGIVRVLPSTHTDLFSPETIERFEATIFRRTLRGNRQGAELAFDGAPFSSASQFNILSEPMVPGDIQMTGDGLPYVLLPECQTTGGYPRLCTILAEDLPIVAQAPPDKALQFQFTTYDDALAGFHSPEALRARIRQNIKPLVLDISTITDLLSYQLISGVVSATEEN